MDGLPNEILIHVLELFPTQALLPLALVSQRFYGLVSRLHYARLVEAIALQDHELILECYHPSAKISTPYMFCDYLGTDGLEAVGLDPTLTSIGNLYSRFRPVLSEEHRRPRARHATKSVLEGKEEPIVEWPTHDIYLEPSELFSQICTIINMIKVGPKRGLFLSYVNVVECVIRIWREWLANESSKPSSWQPDSPSDLASSAIVWTDSSKNYGIRLKVIEKPDVQAPILVGPGEDPPVSTPRTLKSSHSGHGTVGSAANPTARAATPTLGETPGDVPEYIIRHAPLVWLHSQDPFRPSDILQHVQHTTPTVGTEPIANLPELDLDNLDLLNDRPEGNPVALTANEDITGLPTWLYGETPNEAGLLSNATACAVILVESGENAGDVDAFYFYFYSYDRGPNITQVLPPLNGVLGSRIDTNASFGDHVGDWEHNMIRFRGGKPTGIYYSEHSDGSAYDWDHAALTIEDERPIVYSAYGSHANWVSPGNHTHDSVLVDYCDAGLRWDPVSSAYFYHFDSDTSRLSRIFPTGSTETSNFTSFLYFSGRWGDVQYADDDPRQRTVPYFGLKRYVTGPTGPLTKQLVRKGLSPDHKEKRPWIQRAVAIFMLLYPYFFRGWRAWLSGLVFLGVIVTIILCTRRAIKGYLSRRQGYRKVNTGADVPLETLEFRDDITHHSQVN
ncbi:hypothetical protein PFICI_05382 [Pestalotiopsis fici W106-1]|uniref:F-box domain-containing protein n=1 Tax=Pestalotiopsis fici (strain W106-1 / CGMCC3.15140) TaxID=1229662 RepID=W3XE75_PESFW|nr:uncharacterized protein PFICI_05382 [Pestalotiopsis fici W106-1]ETS83506.1 hypothetical protein PFICI_05382 [Pestalotiopsis fici W106-1]